MKSIVFRFGDIAALSDALDDARGALAFPAGAGEDVKDGEWVTAIFEIGSRRRATAAAARAVRAAGDAHLAFERRDWERLVAFASARSEHMRVARPIAGNAGGLGEAAPESRAIPETRIDDREASHDMPAASSRAPFGARVLLVDDDEATRDGVRQILSEVGLRVDLARTPAEARDRLLAATFDALVIDMHAPGLSPLDLVRELRKVEGDVPLPVLFLADGATAKDVVEAFASGGDDFLAKPFRTPELAARVVGLLRRAAGPKGAPPSISGGRA